MRNGLHFIRRYAIFGCVVNMSNIFSHVDDVQPRQTKGGYVLHFSLKVSGRELFAKKSPNTSGRDVNCIHSGQHGIGVTLGNTY